MGQYINKDIENQASVTVKALKYLPNRLTPLYSKIHYKEKNDLKVRTELLIYCRNKGIVYSPPVLTVLRQQRVNQLVTYKRECHGIKEIEIASCATPTF